MEPFDQSKAQIVKLSAERLGLCRDFDCGDDDLNEFLKKDALTYLDGKIAVTYLFLYEGNLAGFFCLSNASIPLEEEDREKLWDLGKPQGSYPAIKIGRLGVRKDQGRKGFGTIILKWVIVQALSYSNVVGCRFITVDAYNKEIPLKFYENSSFKTLTKTRNKRNVMMYLDLLGNGKITP